MALPRGWRTWLAAGLLAAASAHAAQRAAADPLEPARAAIRVKEFDKARALLLPQARRGSADAQYLLGTLELSDLAGKPDPADARHWLELAAAQHHARAAWSLATLLATAEPPDPAAKRWLDEAARLGLPAAEDTAARDALPMQFRPALDLPEAARSDALWRAADDGDLAIVQSLANGPSVQARDAFGRDALARAAAAGHAPLVKLLLERGARADVADLAGQTPLMLAARAGDAPSVAVLLAVQGLHAGCHGSGRQYRADVCGRQWQPGRGGCSCWPPEPARSHAMRRTGRRWILPRHQGRLVIPAPLPRALPHAAPPRCRMRRWPPRS